MDVLQEVNILTNKKLVIGLNVGAILLMFPFFVLFGDVLHGLTGQEVLESTSIWEPLFAMVFFMGVLVIHELIHGLFFKVFHPAGKVKYGIKWSSMMVYATSPGSLYKRGQMLVIGLAPFVLITAALTVGVMFGWVSPFLYLTVAALHAAGCVGDFYYAYLLLIKHGQKDILVEDTETGLIIYAT